MTDDSTNITIEQIGNISQISGMLAIGGDVVAGNKTVIQHIIQQRELIVHPYKFLSSYDISDKNIFFGRDTLTKQLAGKVARHKVLLLNGAPGSGKSSLINAGLIPHLAENGYTYLSFRDYSDPLQQLQNCLIKMGISPVSSLQPEFLLHTLTAFKNSKLQVIFVFDQFERFFVNVSPATRGQFIEMIKVCMETLPPTEMNVVFSIREKFFGQFQKEFEQVIYAFLNECERVNIAPLSKTEARQAIIKPLRLIQAKIGYDDEFVDDILLVGLEAEIIEKGISPSHLQIVCNQLYQAACQQLEHKDFVVIGHKLYEQLGGTPTILRTYLDDRVTTVANHDLNHIQLLHSLLKQMVETAGTRKFVTAQQLYRNLPDVAPSQIDDFLSKLQEARVIEMRSQEASYSLSHEFMVAKVKDWFDEREMARKRAEETLDHGLSEWKNSETLLTEKQITRIRTAQIALNAEEEEFLCASEIECNKQRREEEEQTQRIQQITLEREIYRETSNYQRKVIQLGFATIVIAIFGISYFNLREQTNELRQETKTLSEMQKNQSSALADVSSQTLEKGDKVTAMSLALAALPRNMDDPKREYDRKAVESLRNAFYSRIEHSLKHDSTILSVKFSPDNQRVVTTSRDKTVKIWNVKGEHVASEPIATLEHEKEVDSAKFSPDSQKVMTISSDETVIKIWNVKDEPIASKPIATLPHQKGVSSAKFSPDGQKVVSVSLDGTAKIWKAIDDSTTSEPIATLENGKEVSSAEFSPDGQKVMTVSEGETAKIWKVMADSITSEPIATLKHGKEVSSAEFSPDGQKVMTVSEGETAKIWKVTGDSIATLPEKVLYAEFSRDSQKIQKIMTVSVGGIAKIWKVMGDSIESQPITTLPEKVFYAEFSDDAQKVMTVAVDETAKVWQVIDDSSIASEPIAILKRENGLSLPAEFSHDGQKVITYSGNIALIWDVAHQNESFKSDQELIDAARKLVEKEFAKSDHK